jgi:hypothetical protein
MGFCYVCTIALLCKLVHFSAITWPLTAALAFNWITCEISKVGRS